MSSWICSVVSKPRGSRISASLVSDYFFLTFLLLLARTEDRELLACLLCMISSTWNLPGFGGTSIEGTVTKFLGHRMFCVPKGDRRKERGSALPRLHGTDFPCDLLDLTFCEKTKGNNMRSTIHAWVIFFLYLRQGGFGLVICVWQSFILPPHQPPPNFQPLRSKPSPPDLERTISDFIQFVTWNRPESLTECYWPWQANSFMPSGTVDRCDLFLP